MPRLPPWSDWASYEPELEAALSRFVGPGMVAFDVGAHLGEVAYFLAHRVGGRRSVFAFEPQPANIRAIRSGIRRHRLGARIEAIHAAVCDRTGTAEFRSHHRRSMGKLAGSAGRLYGYGQSFEVPCVSLDDMVFRRGIPLPDVVKIDVEGGEGKVVEGMREIMDRRPPILFIELHGLRATRAVWGPLSSRGYHFVRLAPPPYADITAIEQFRWKERVLVVPPDQPAP